MTYAPATLLDLGRFYEAQGGAMLGIVGDTDHAARGVSYHLGEDQLTADAYSRQTLRDRRGLTNAASAIDLGRIDGSLPKLRAFSTWLVAQGRANAPGTQDIREIIFSPDGRVVLRWDRQRGYASMPQAGEADDTHLMHTHVSYYRDSEARDKIALFTTYGEFDVSDTINAGEGVSSTRIAQVRPGANWYHDGETTVKGGTLTAGATVPYIGAAKGGGRAVIIRTKVPYDDGIIRPTIAYVKAADAIISDAPVPPAPDCATEVAAAIAADRARAHIVYE